MPAEEREAVQKDWSAGKVQVIVATIAFGMGINKVCTAIEEGRGGQRCTRPQAECTKVEYNLISMSFCNAASAARCALRCPFLSPQEPRGVPPGDRPVSPHEGGLWGRSEGAYGGARGGSRRGQGGAHGWNPQIMNITGLRNYKLHFSSRAGRDNREAYCYLFYSYGDAQVCIRPHLVILEGQLGFNVWTATFTFLSTR